MGKKVKDSVDVSSVLTQHPEVRKAICSKLGIEPMQVAQAFMSTGVKPVVSFEKVEDAWLNSDKAKLDFLKGQYGDTNLKQAIKVLEDAGTDWKQGVQTNDARVAYQLVAAIEAIIVGLKFTGDAK